MANTPRTPTSDRTSLTGLFKNKFAIAFLLFCLVSICAKATNFGQVQAIDFPYLSWTGWTIKDFYAAKSRPQIVFFGSSLMLVPLAGVDADYLKRRVDGSEHHKSNYIEAEIEKLGHKHTETFNFALPGEMPSDAFLITDFLLKGNKKPDVIVWGIGPRDFLDNLLPSPSATDPFQFLSRFGDISPIAHLVMPDWMERMNHQMGEWLYLYKRKTDLATSGNLIASNYISDVLPAPNGKSISPDDHHLLLPDYRPFELKRQQAFFRPTTDADREGFVDNLAEYRKRYKNMKWDTFSTQMEFFARTLDKARERNIKVIVVAMPITDLNRSLLTDTAWTAYTASARVIAGLKEADFIDLSESDKFTRKDFGDTVHLHSGGGKRLMDIIVAELINNKAAASSLGIANTGNPI